MQSDKTTLKDLSIFTSENSGGIFALIDHANTQVGRDELRRLIYQPPTSFGALQKLQDTVKFWYKHQDEWPSVISNGTIVMLEKFFESADSYSVPTGFTKIFSAFVQKLFNRNEYSFTKFSISHLEDFLNGCVDLANMLDAEGLPELLRNELEAIKGELQHRLVPAILKVDKDTPYADISQLTHNARREMKNMVYRLISHYARIDAWRSMALATLSNNWVFPELKEDTTLCFEAQGLYHPLLETPVAYDVDFSEQRNFLLLTGANMSGKTTFMRAIGVTALLAHIGMGVPAQKLKISMLEGIVTNMQVEDNLLLGESYFFAEVQRMKMTAGKLVQKLPHLVLMDELFKGTNVHDAYECTRAVVDGLLQRPEHMMILSTHLYEVAQHFKDKKEIIFAYFVTQMQEDGSYNFTYELRQGISNDRIGYRILQKEGVLDLLHQKSKN